MLIEFTLYSDAFLKHDKVIELPDTVELLFYRTPLAMGTLTLTVTNGVTEKQYKVNKEPIDVSEMFTIPGEVKASLTLSVRGKPARRWQIEPFCVRQIDAGFVVIPEIIALKEEVATLKRAIIEINALVQNN